MNKSNRIAQLTYRVQGLAKHKNAYLPMCFLLLFLTFSCITLAQSGAILGQEREGSATLYLSEDTSVAYVLDGGNIGGLTKPLLDGKPVLQRLLELGYRRLVLSCSHPHEDHAAGIKELIRIDPNIERFASIRFVDSGYPTGQSLFTLFRQHHPDYQSARVSYSSATGQDAFAAFSGVKDAAHVGNFIYTPEAGAVPHGHPIIAHISLQKGGKLLRIVDFDDANDQLVRKWSDWAMQDPVNRRPDVIVAPHHGSDNNDVSPLLKLAIRPKSCIITANENNRYFHPGPKNLAKWIQALGKENVHITGSSGTIRFTEAGLPPIADQDTFRATAEKIIQPQIERNSKELLAAQSSSAAVGPIAAKRFNELKREEAALKALKGMYAGVKPAETPRAVVRPRAVYGTVCEICGAPAVGKCSIRQIYVCDTHRYFTRNGMSYVCPH